MNKLRKNTIIAIMIMFTMLLITSTVFAEEWKSILNVNEEESSVRFNNEGNRCILTTDNKIVKIEENKNHMLENENCSFIIDEETGLLTEIKTKEGSDSIGNNEGKEKSEQVQKEEVLLYGIIIIITMFFMYTLEALLNEISKG